jgi:hypothetical protein
MPALYDNDECKHAVSNKAVVITKLMVSNRFYRRVIMKRHQIKTQNTYLRTVLALGALVLFVIGAGAPAAQGG